MLVDLQSSKYQKGIEVIAALSQCRWRRRLEVTMIEFYGPINRPTVLVCYNSKPSSLYLGSKFLLSIFKVCVILLMQYLDYVNLYFS